MSMMVSFVLSFFPRDVLDEILNLIESVSEDFPSYFFKLAFSSLLKRCHLWPRPAPGDKSENLVSGRDEAIVPPYTTCAQLASFVSHKQTLFCL